MLYELRIQVLHDDYRMDNYAGRQLAVYQFLDLRTT